MRSFRLKISRVAFFLLACVLMQLISAGVNPFEFAPLSLATATLYISFFACAMIPLISLNARLKLPAKADAARQAFKASGVSTVAWLYLIPCIAGFVSALLFVVINDIPLQLLRDLFFFGDGTVLPFVFGDVFLILSAYVGLGYYLLISYAVRYQLYGGVSDRLSILVLSASIFLLDSATGGRMSVFYITTLHFIVFLLFGHHRRRVFRGRTVKLWLIFAAAVFLTILLSRIGSDGSLGKFFYVYFIGPTFLMNQGLQDTSGLMSDVDIRFGMSAMSVDWVFIGVQKLAGANSRTLLDLSNAVLATGYDLGGGVEMNAHYTAPFYFVLDFGLFAGFGVALYVAVIFIIARYFGGIQKKLTILLFLLFFLFVGLRENILNSPTFLFTFLLIFIFPFRRPASQKYC